MGPLDPHRRGVHALCAASANGAEAPLNVDLAARAFRTAPPLRSQALGPEAQQSRGPRSHNSCGARDPHHREAFGFSLGLDWPNDILGCNLFCQGPVRAAAATGGPAPAIFPAQRRVVGGKYEVLEEIGHGGSCRVYLAQERFQPI